MTVFHQDVTPDILSISVLYRSIVYAKWWADFAFSGKPYFYRFICVGVYFSLPKLVLNDVEMILQRF